MIPHHSGPSRTWLQSLSERISPSPGRPTPPSSISMQNLVPVHIPTPNSTSLVPKEKETHTKPVIVSFLGTSVARQASIINALLRATTIHTSNLPGDDIGLPKGLIYSSNYSNPLQKQQVHEVISPPVDFMRNIDLAKERESLYQSPNVIQAGEPREASFFDIHSFCIPQSHHPTTSLWRDTRSYNYISFSDSAQSHFISALPVYIHI